MVGVFMWQSHECASWEERLPGARPARYLCSKYPIFSPKFILT